MLYKYAHKFNETAIVIAKYSACMQLKLMPEVMKPLNNDSKLLYQERKGPGVYLMLNAYCCEHEN